MENVITEFLRYLKIPISKKYINTFLLSHTEYPSLLSISDLFENLGLNYSIHRIDKERIEELEFPYLLPLKKTGGSIIEIKNRLDLEKQKANLEYWNGVVVLVESTNEISNTKHNLIFKKERIKKGVITGIIMGTLILLGYSLFSAFSWFSLTWTITTLAGLLVSYFIFTKDLGVKHSIIEKFCNVGKTVNCDKILKSENSKLFDIIKFSDLVISFFLFQLILLIAISLSINFSHIIWIIFLAASIATIPIIAYSIYVQYFIEKSWCLLCLLVTFVLISQLVLILNKSMPDIIFESIFNLPVILFPFISFMIILGMIFTIRNEIEDSNKIYLLAVKAMRIKNSAKVFFHLLTQQKEVDVTPLEYEMTIGNPDAAIKIIFASNLYCTPCKEQHEIAKQLVNLFPDKVMVSFRFVNVWKQFNDNISTNQYLIQYWLSNIFGKNNEYKLTEKLLGDWYREMDINKFSYNHPLPSNNIDEVVINIEEIQNKWANDAIILKTPSIFINGFELPEFYNLEDLPDLISELENLLTIRNIINLVPNN